MSNFVTEVHVGLGTGPDDMHRRSRMNRKGPAERYALIRTVQLFGGISSVRDYKAKFLAKYYQPYVASRALTAEDKPAAADVET